MHRLPGAVLGLPSLRALWLEANPLDDVGDLRPSSEEAHHLSLGPALKNVGLDQFQAGRFSSPLPAAGPYAPPPPCAPLSQGEAHVGGSQRAACCDRVTSDLSCFVALIAATPPRLPAIPHQKQCMQCYQRPIQYDYPWQQAVLSIRDWRSF